MITDSDIQKLKAVFATKDDLKSMETRITHDVDTKIHAAEERIVQGVDVKIHAAEERIVRDVDTKIQTMETRIERDVSHTIDIKIHAAEERIVKDVADVLQDGIIKILDEHEKRIDRLEKHVGGFPSIA